MKVGEGEGATYLKVPFEWTDTCMLKPESSVADPSWSVVANDEAFVDLLGQVLATTPDESDRRSVQRLGPAGAARELLALAEGPPFA